MYHKWNIPVQIFEYLSFAQMWKGELDHSCHARPRQ